MPSQTTTTRLFAMLAVALTALPSLGQIVDLNPVIATKSAIAATDQGEIDTFINEHAKLLASGDAAAVTRSRNALLKPLESPNVTRAFRQAYGRSAIEPAKTLLASDDAVARMAGLRLAGKLGTDEAVQLLLDRLDDPDEGTRFFVITCLGDTMSTLTTSSASLSTETADNVVKALGSVILNADSSTFADAAVRALASAARITQPSMASTRSLVIVTLAESAGERLHRLKAKAPHASEEMIAALRACGAVRDVISDTQITVSPAAATAAIRLGADCVGYVYSRVRSGAMAASGAKNHEVALVSAGEIVIYYGRVALKEASPPQTNLYQQLEGGNEREFNFRASELIGPESSIVATIGADRNRFIRPASED